MGGSKMEGRGGEGRGGKEEGGGEGEEVEKGLA